MEATETVMVELTNDLPAKSKEYQKEIKALKEKHSGLVLTDLADKKTYELIKSARIEFKTMRVGVQKYCKDLRDQATKYSKAVSAKEAEIVGEISEGENRLAGEEQKYLDEQQRIIDEEKKKAQERAAARIKLIISLGM